MLRRLRPFTPSRVFPAIISLDSHIYPPHFPPYRILHLLKFNGKSSLYLFRGQIIIFPSFSYNSRTVSFAARSARKIIYRTRSLLSQCIATSIPIKLLLKLINYRIKIFRDIFHVFRRSISRSRETTNCFLVAFHNVAWKRVTLERNMAGIGATVPRAHVLRERFVRLKIREHSRPGGGRRRANGADDVVLFPSSRISRDIISRW